jgi:hypothetical protein
LQMSEAIRHETPAPDTMLAQCKAGVLPFSLAAPTYDAPSFQAVGKGAT